MLFNKQRAIAYMREHDLDALVATSPVNITYFSDYSWWLDSLFKEYMVVPGGSGHLLHSGYAVFPVEGEPALILESMLAVNAYDLWVRDLYPFGEFGFVDPAPPINLSDPACRVYDLVRRSNVYASSLQALSAALRARDLVAARIGIELEGVPSRTLTEIVDALPGAEIRDCTNLIRLVRAVKSEEELQRLSRAAEISEAAARETFREGEPGSRVSELVDHFRRLVAERGADYDHLIFGAGGLGITTRPDYVLLDGYVGNVDFGCVYRHYFSDSGATLVMGAAPDTVLQTITALDSAIRTGSEAIRPGARASEAQAAMAARLAEDGVSGMLCHGHGLGIEIRDYPIVVPNNGLVIGDDCIQVESDLRFEVDMVVNLEIALYEPGVRSFNNEQTFVVTAGGARRLMPYERGRPIRAGRAEESPLRVE